MRSVVLHDEASVGSLDLQKLQELNPDVELSVISTELSKEQLSKFQVVVFNDMSLAKMVEYNSYCHHNQASPPRFILTGVKGSKGYIFTDLGYACVLENGKELNFLTLEDALADPELSKQAEKLLYFFSNSDEDILNEDLAADKPEFDVLLTPMASIVGHEVRKASTGKSNPIFQFFFYDSTESLLPTVEADFTPSHLSVLAHAFVVKNNPNFEQVFEWLGLCGLKPLSVSCQNQVLFEGSHQKIPHFPQLKVNDLFKEGAMVKISPDCSYVDVEMTCADQNGEEIQIEFPVFPLFP